MRHWIAGLLAGLLLAPGVCRAGSVETAGDILQFVPLATALAMTFAYEDYEGLGQLGKSAAFTGVATVVLKYSVNAERPNGKDHSFPSGHTATAFSGASFLQRRYGWRLGVPAYAIASFVAWSRVESDNHYPRDVAVGAVLAIASTYLFVDPLPLDMRFTPVVGTGAWGFMVGGRW